MRALISMIVFMIAIFSWLIGVFVFIMGDFELFIAFTMNGMFFLMLMMVDDMQRRQ